MMRNTDISTIMSAILGNLMPVCGKEANPELWLIYNEMQRWEILVEGKAPLFSDSEPAKTVDMIRQYLGKLSDRRLAMGIEQVLLRYTPETPAH